MLGKLSLLSNLVKFVDPELMAHLEANQSGDCLFCFRWLLVNFKREFNQDDAQLVWEVRQALFAPPFPAPSVHIPSALKPVLMPWVLGRWFGRSTSHSTLSSSSAWPCCRPSGMRFCSSSWVLRTFWT